MERLERLLNEAKESNARYFAIQVLIGGNPSNEIIINQRESFDEKLAYYKKTYDEDLKHKFADIWITDFIYGDSFDEIEKMLDWYE